MNKKSFRTLSSLALAIATASSGAYGAQLEEIIVTAQKRAESLQDVPISMTALDGKRMEDAGVASFAQLSAYVPNLSISENAVNTIITMRGISVGANQSFEQSVGIYVDGVHYGRSRQVRSGLFDLQQVEVLAGPQGILFGKNTLAGAINVTTAEPTMGDELSGSVAVSRESFDGEIIEGHINHSPSDNLAFRVAVKDRQDGGYMKNGFATAANGANPGMPTTDESMFRLTTVWDPTDDVSMKLTHTESDYTRVGGVAALTTFAPLANIAQSNALMYGVMATSWPDFGPGVAAGVIDPYRDSISIGGLALSQSLGRDGDRTEEKTEGTDTQTRNTALNVEMDLDSGYSLAMTYGKNSYDYEDGIDADFLPVQFIGRSDISSYDSDSLEFRLASPADQDFSFITGAYWSSAEQNIDRLVIIDGTLGNPALMAGITGLPSFLAFSPAQVGGALGISAEDALAAGLVGVEGSTLFSQVGRVSNWNNETDSWAVYFQGTYNISDTVSVTAGVRYTEEDKSVHAQTDLTTNSTGLTNANPHPFLAALQASSFDSYAHVFDEDRSTDQLMPAFNIQWEASDTSKYYLSYTEGFKSGGFNAVDDQNPVIQADGTVLRTTPGVGFEYDDETASSFEIGGKHTLLDGAMSLNWAYFNSEYEDQQVSTFVGLGFVVANAASSEIQGLEIDMKWQASDNLLLGASLAMLDGEYGTFDAAGCTAAQASALLGLGDITSSSPVTSALGCQQQFLGNGEPSGSSQDISGGKLGADYGGSLTADYSAPMANGMTWFVSMDINFTDNFFMTGDLDPIDEQVGFEKINLRAGIRGDNWDLMFYGRNITDEITASGAFDVPLAAGSHARYMESGELYGARFSYSF